jgi:hypothetical protein
MREEMCEDTCRKIISLVNALNACYQEARLSDFYSGQPSTLTTALKIANIDHVARRAEVRSETRSVTAAPAVAAPRVDFSVDL